jgi:hypothetical protein
LSFCPDPGSSSRPTVSTSVWTSPAFSARSSAFERLESGLHNRAPPPATVSLLAVDLRDRGVDVVAERVLRHDVLHKVLFRRAAVVADVGARGRDGRRRVLAVDGSR